MKKNDPYGYRQGYEADAHQPEYPGARYSLETLRWKGDYLRDVYFLADQEKVESFEELQEGDIVFVEGDNAYRIVEILPIPSRIDPSYQCTVYVEEYKVKKDG